MNYREVVNSRLLVILLAACIIVIGAVDMTALLSPESNCSGAFGDTNSWSLNETIVSIFHNRPAAGRRLSLQSVNVGFGTTGTRTVFHYEARRFKKACHFIRCVPGPQTNELTRHFELLAKCVHLRGSCSGAQWLQTARRMLNDIVVGGINAMTDTPTPIFVREFIDLVPNIEVLHSVRDPVEWVIHRVAEHGHGELLCNPATSTGRKTSNPFHILECLNRNPRVLEVLTTMLKFLDITQEEAVTLQDMERSQIPSELMERIIKLSTYYVDWTRRIANTVRPENKYRPICVWDNYMARNGTLLTNTPLP